MCFIIRGCLIKGGRDYVGFRVSGVGFRFRGSAALFM